MSRLTDEPFGVVTLSSTDWSGSVLDTVPDVVRPSHLTFLVFLLSLVTKECIRYDSYLKGEHRFLIRKKGERCGFYK